MTTAILGNIFLEMDFPSSPDDIRAVFFNNLSDFHLQKMLVEDSKFAEVGCQKSMEIKCVLEGQASKETKRSINRIKEAMEAGINPAFVGDTSTTACFYLRDSERRIVSVFKPQRVRSDSNSTIGPVRNRMMPSEGTTALRKGFSAGGEGSREIAAYLLDKMHMSDVPNTTMISLAHPLLKGHQIGSMQAYAPHFCSAEDVSSSKFSVHQVHKIALLDVRMFNTDRHAGNMLVGFKTPKAFPTARDLTKNNTTLVPIDHGFCLPEFPALGEATFEWMNWRQSHEPLHPDLLSYIRSINMDRDIACLRQVLGKNMLSMRVLLTLRVCTMWLQLAACNGLTFYQMGQFLCRPDLDGLSPLERIVKHLKVDDLVIRNADRVLSTLQPVMLKYIIHVREKAKLCQHRVHCTTPVPQPISV